MASTSNGPQSNASVNCSDTRLRRHRSAQRARRGEIDASVPERNAQTARSPAAAGRRTFDRPFSGPQAYQRCGQASGQLRRSGRRACPCRHRSRALDPAVREPPYSPAARRSPSAAACPASVTRRVSRVCPAPPALHVSCRRRPRTCTARKARAARSSPGEGVIWCRALSRPRPAVNEATVAALRGEQAPFQRRLPLGYSRSGDARPGRHQIGSGCSALRDEGIARK